MSSEPSYRHLFIITAGWKLEFKTWISKPSWARPSSHSNLLKNTLDEYTDACDKIQWMDFGWRIQTSKAANEFWDREKNNQSYLGKKSPGKFKFLYKFSAVMKSNPVSKKLIWRTWICFRRPLKNITSPTLSFAVNSRPKRSLPHCSNTFGWPVYSICIHLTANELELPVVYVFIGQNLTHFLLYVTGPKGENSQSSSEDGRRGRQFVSW